MLVDPYGRVMGRTAIFEEGFLAERLPVRSDTTIYARYGDVFPWGAALVGGLMLLLGLSGSVESHARPPRRRN